MIIIIFEAHATSVDNESHRASGHSNPELSETGKQQAKELGQRYVDEKLDVIFCSDLQRAYQTAKLAFQGREIPIIQDVRLRECDYGDLTGGSSKEVERSKTRHISEPFPNGESYEQAVERIKNFLQDLLKNYNGKKVMIIGHRATQYGLEHWINGKPLEQLVSNPFKWQPGWSYELEQL